ncbi:MAG: hypothetical protein A2289_14740 [Deltaproteobacteria bacterium RIFOXYA12_FULL_58_15]|nr:MAG: hypothetical protein A2289_14740 [Deltaproteobacteria bacterium RIFOXYA12_FULL_58_15]OGR07844.1 MAG: hypothetical protein A2341_07200 [Deltaproteobacteria bacterium RIFOXYB12_FULL_58_9]
MGTAIDKVDYYLRRFAGGAEAIGSIPEGEIDRALKFLKDNGVEVSKAQVKARIRHSAKIAHQQEEQGKTALIVGLGGKGDEDAGSASRRHKLAGSISSGVFNLPTTVLTTPPEREPEKVVLNEYWYSAEQPMVRQRYWQGKRVSINPGHQPDLADIANLVGGTERTFGQITVLISESLIHYFVKGREAALLCLSHEHGKIYEVHALAPADTIATHLTLNGSDELPLREDLRRWLNLPGISSDMILAEKYRMNAQEEENRRVAELRTKAGRRVVDSQTGQLVPTTATRNDVPDVADAKEVPQGHYGIVRFGERKHSHIKTCGLGPCVGVTLYDPTTRTGCIAHDDAGKNMEASLWRILADFQKAGANIDKLEARVIGGETSGTVEGPSELVVLDVLRALERQGISIVEMDILGDQPRSIIMDVETGAVSDFTFRSGQMSELEEQLASLSTRFTLNKVLLPA